MRIMCFGIIFDYMIQLANALSEKEKVMLILPNGAPGDIIDTLNDQVDSFLVGKGLSLRSLYFHPLKALSILKELIKKIDDFNPDIIHFQAGGDGKFDLFMSMLSFIRKYPLVTTLHNPEPYKMGGNMYVRMYRKVIYNRIKKYANQIVVHGVKLKEITMEKFSFPSARVHVVPFGEQYVAPFKKYEVEGIEEDRNAILFFGGIQKYKGLEYLIRAEPLITTRVSDAKIIIAGAGEDFKKYERMMVNKDNFVVYNRWIDYKEGAELFQRCNIVVLPYTYASQSAVIPPAYAFKKPVVVTDVGALSEIVDDGVTGFIVPPRDPEALADAIVKLLKDEDLRREMGENGYKKLKMDLSWDKIADKTVEVYEKAIYNFKK